MLTSHCPRDGHQACNCPLGATWRAACAQRSLERSQPWMARRVRVVPRSHPSQLRGSPATLSSTRMGLSGWFLGCSRDACRPRNAFMRSKAQTFSSSVRALCNLSIGCRLCWALLFAWPHSHIELTVGPPLVLHVSLVHVHTLLPCAQHSRNTNLVLSIHHEPTHIHTSTRFGLPVSRSVCSRSPTSARASQRSGSMET